MLWSLVFVFMKNMGLLFKKFETCPSVDNPSLEWTNLKNQLQLGPAWLMYRRAGGNYKEG